MDFRLLLTLCFATVVIVSCDQSKMVSQIDSEQIKSDSLNARSDSIQQVRQMHSIVQGKHVHDPNSNLAAVAHQDPKRTKRLMETIQKNEGKRVATIQSQNERVRELIKKKREQAQQPSSPL